MVKDTSVKIKVRSEYGLDCEGRKGLRKTVVANTGCAKLDLSVHTPAPFTSQLNGTCWGLAGCSLQTRTTLACSRRSIKVCFKNCARAAVSVSLMKQADSSLLKTCLQFYRLPWGSRVGVGVGWELGAGIHRLLSFTLNLSRWNCLAPLTFWTLLLISILQRRHCCFILFISLCSLPVAKLPFLPLIMYRAIKQK